MRVVDIAVVRDKLNNQIKDLRNKLAVYENLRPAPIVVEKSSDLTAVKEEVKKLSNKMKGLARTAFKTSEEVARRKAEEDAARAEHARAAAQSEEDKRRQLEDAKILVEHATQVLGNSFNSYLLQGCITVNSNAFKEALADVRFDLKSLSVADWKRARDQMKKIAKSFPESVRGKLLSKIPEEPPKLIAEYAQSSVPISTVSKHHPQLPTGGLRRHANMDAENERMLEAQDRQRRRTAAAQVRKNSISVPGQMTFSPKIRNADPSKKKFNTLSPVVKRNPWADVQEQVRAILTTPVNRSFSFLFRDRNSAKTKFLTSLQTLFEQTSSDQIAPVLQQKLAELKSDPKLYGLVTAGWFSHRVATLLTQIEEKLVNSSAEISMPTPTPGC